jgi:alkaline phosphatase D
LASDERLQTVVQSGTAWADAQWACSVHVEPAGLEPGRQYWYRFRAGEFESAIGRTRTAPAFGASLQKLRIAAASCQQYEQGYYAAYRHMVSDEPDLVLHLGDYIYELSSGVDLVRRHAAPECYTLEDYRLRHALYRSDVDLQAAHAACPWLVTWDDHEVDNDYAGAVSEENNVPELFLARRAAAYRAYYEHMPLPRRAVPFGSNMRLHAAGYFGDLLQLLVLDGRQYRSPIACAPLGRRGGTSAYCAELAERSRTMLGPRQEEWISGHLERGRAAWTILAQQTVMTRIDEQPGPGERFWTDAWSGYPAARERLLAALAARKEVNPVVLSGDIHAFGAANLNSVPENPDSPIVASEFVTTSITSQGVAEKLAGQVKSENPNLLFGDPTHRGYLRLDLRPNTVRADCLAVDDVRRRDSAVQVLRSFVVEAGKPGPQAA